MVSVVAAAGVAGWDRAAGVAGWDRACPLYNGDQHVGTFQMAGMQWKSLLK